MRRSERRGGFNLIEIAVAVSILAVAVTGLLSAVFSVYRLDLGAREHAIATEAATERLEAIYATPFDEVLLVHSDLEFDVPGLAPGKADPDGRVGRVEVVVADPELLQVTVEVRWSRSTGETTLTFPTLLSRRVPR